MNKKQNWKKCYEQCPKCGSDNIEYTCSEVIDDSYRCEAFCNVCDCYFYEFYKLVYDETMWDI